MTDILLSPQRPDLPAAPVLPAALVLASDVVGCGDATLFPPLVKTLCDLCAGGAPVLMSYKWRDGFEAEFFQQMEARAATGGAVLFTPPSLFSMENH